MVKTREACGEGKSKHSSIVTTNMLHLYRYAKHLGCQQRIEIIKDDKPFVDTDIADVTDDNGAGFVEESVKEDVHVKDYIPAMKAICDKLEQAEGKVSLSHLYYHESTSYVINLVLTVFGCVFHCKVLTVSDIKRDLGYRKSYGHRAWRNVSFIYFLPCLLVIGLISSALFPPLIILFIFRYCIG